MYEWWDKIPFKYTVFINACAPMLRTETIDQFFKLGLKKSMDIIKKIIGKSKTYLSFDIDGIDPTYAPGTGTPEVGGFTVRESQNILRELNGINFIGADVVEVSPPFDTNNQTSLVAANIAFEILCLITKTSKKI